MKIAIDWPIPEVLIKNEIRTLEEMESNPSLSQEQGSLVKAAYDKHRLYMARDPTKMGFSFSSWIELPTSPIAKKAFIECLIIPNPKEPYSYNMLTYSFALCGVNGRGEDHLIKKFHIDFTYFSDTGRPPLHPIFHLQSPGKSSDMLKERGIDDKHLEPSLSEPRLCCAPTTLALLTDFLLREFGGDKASPLTRLTSEPRWRGLIRRNEELVLEPYFKACSGFFHDRRSKKKPEHNQLFSQDFAYGKP